MAEIDFGRCIDLANRRLRDVVTAAKQADAKKMASLMLSSMCGEESEFTYYNDTENTKITLYGDQTKGIYFMFNCYKFHITKDSEFNALYTTNMYHLWCLRDYFKNVEDPVKHVHVAWLYGAAFLEEKHAAFVAGQISQNEFEQYLWDEVYTYCSDWLKKNIGDYYG